MKNSSIFDPPMGFSQFLEEARQHASSLSCEGRKSLGGEEKKGKKSWRSKVLSWLKPDKKIKTNKVSKEGSGSVTHIANPRRVHVSEPIYGSGRKVETKCQRPVSGPTPLTTLFNPTKRMDREVPYMCLDSNLNSPKSQSQQGFKAYGPVYLVT